MTVHLVTIFARIADMFIQKVNENRIYTYQLILPNIFLTCSSFKTKGPAAWAKEDKDKYKCPPCGAPKFRFQKVPKGSANGKVEVKKSWF